ncbi:MAG TPA: flagellar hook protein FlgE [Syntrophales bacterium]|nr:flagellar hook protein FlgE [Syntrophales bacterium]
MGSALWAGISGLNASSTEMDVIANNVANVNTIGYKVGKTYFADVLSQSLSGGTSGSMQVGRGVQVTEVATQFGPGSFETTGNATDVAIDGDGFFIVNDLNGASYYTRAGSFHLNTDGDLVDTNGYKVQGYNFFGNIVNNITDINLSNVQSAPVATTIFSVGANLNADTATGDTFTTTQTVFDTLGDKHSLGITFKKTEANNMWGFQVALDGVNAPGQTYTGLQFDNTTGDITRVYSAAMAAPAGGGGVTVGAPTLVDLGQMYKTATGAITLTAGATPATWTITANGGYTNMSVSGTTAAGVNYVNIDLDGAGGPDITIPLTAWAAGGTIGIASITHTAVAPADNAITFAALPTGATIGNGNTVDWNLVGNGSLQINDYASTSVINSLSNDGYASGLLKSLSVKSDGTINGFFTNGQTANVAQIVLANFADPEGLKKMGSNLFGETISSGPAIRNVPGASGMGNVASNSLEMSNTDIATEFINMITAQKAYSANARVITTEDQMLTELINIKR